MDERQSELLRKHVIPALDVEDRASAIALADHLGGKVAMVKIGSKLFTRYGPELLEQMKLRELDVFLDLKFHDIPNTVGDACRMAARHPSVKLMTIHASGGSSMISAAVEGARESSGGRAKIVAVTVLTSISAAQTHLLGVELSVEEWAKKLGRLALDAGADGLVCSAEEAGFMRQVLGEDFILVTPGIRPESYQKNDDQARVMTPRAALDEGSNYLVIGRPIYAAEDPAAALEMIGSSL